VNIISSANCIGENIFIFVQAERELVAKISAISPVTPLGRRLLGKRCALSNHMDFRQFSLTKAIIVPVVRA
jgi:hypothetical protein